MDCSRMMFIVILLGALLTASKSAVTYHPPPAVVENTLATFTLPAGGTTWITPMHKIEGLAITADTSNPAAPTTTFTYKIFNRSATDNHNTYTLTKPGVWSHLKCTNEDLSCCLFETTVGGVKTYGLTVLATEVGVGINAAISVGAFEAAMEFAVTENLLPAGADFTQFIPGKNCHAGYLMGSMYRIANGQLQVLTLAGDPTPFVLQAATEDFNYVVANNKLYRYDATTNYYV